MSTLHQAVTDYLGIRRALGFKLERHGRLLPDLAGYLEQAGATTLTIALALDWATSLEGHPDERAIRLSIAEASPAGCRRSTPRPRCLRLICCPAAAAGPTPTYIPRPTSSRSWQPR